MIRIGSRKVGCPPVGSLKAGGCFLVSLSAFLLSQPPFELHGLVWVAFVPVLYRVVRRRSPQSVLSYLGCYLAGYALLLASTVLYGVALFAGALAWTVLVLAVTHAVLPFYFERVPRTDPVRDAVVFGSLWVMYEWIRALLLPGHIAWGLYSVDALVWTARYAGPYGLDFLIVFSNVLGAGLLAVGQRRGVRAWVVPLGACALGLAVAALAVVGLGRHANVAGDDRSARPVDSLTVGAVQSGLSERVLSLREASESALLRRWPEQVYARLTDSLLAASGAVDLVVWPENAPRRDLLTDDPMLARIQEQSRRWKTHFIVGVQYPVGARIGLRRDWEEPPAYNLALHVGRQGRSTAYHAKSLFVPFVEHYRRAAPQVLTVDAVRVGVSICYESLFESRQRAYLRDGAGLLVVVSDPTGLKRTALPTYHLASDVFTAAGMNRSLVRASASGQTAIIDNRGRIVAQAGAYEPGYVVATVPTLSQTSFYARFPRLGVWLCVAGLVLGLAVPRPGPLRGGAASI